MNLVRSLMEVLRGRKPYAFSRAASGRAHDRHPTPPAPGMVQIMPVLPELSPPVADALAAGRPVVALESTIISHGLPRPGNLDAARSFEALLTEAGVTPATIAVVDGVPKAGLSDADLERIALNDDVIKVSRRDLPLA